jgi:hypothetical protein
MSNASSIGRVTVWCNVPLSLERSAQSVSILSVVELDLRFGIGNGSTSWCEGCSRSRRTELLEIFYFKCRRSKDCYAEFLETAEGEETWDNFSLLERELSRCRIVEKASTLFCLAYGRCIRSGDRERDDSRTKAIARSKSHRWLETPINQIQLLSGTVTLTASVYNGIAL